MADPKFQFIEDAVGRARKTADPDQVERLRREGKEVVSPQQAARQFEEEQAIQHVDENYGSAMQAGMGLMQGATLGMGGPAIAKVLGMMDPAMKASALRDLQGLEGGGLYEAGHLAGVLAPMAFGGEGLLGLTPAGMAARAGTVAEELMARKAIPEAASALGKVGSRFLSAGVRGGVENAAYGLGEHVGQSIIHDHDLTIQSALAATGEGALMGFLMGGAIGGTGEAIGQASRAVKAPSSLAGEGAVYRHLGASSEADLAAIRKAGTWHEMSVGEDGTMAVKKTGYTEPASAIKKLYEEKLNADGLGMKRSPAEMARMAKEFGKDSSKVVQDGIRTLDREATGFVPSLERIYGRMDQDILAPVLGTAKEKETLSALKLIKSELKPIEPTANTFPQASGAAEPVKGTWEKWFQSREQIYQATKGLDDNLKSQVLTVIDSEINSAVEAAAEQIGRKGLAESIKSAVAGQRLAEVFQNLSDAKAADAILKQMPLVTPPEMGAMAGMVAMNHPASALGYGAAKGIQRLLHPKIEPWMAEMAYRGSIGAKAAASVPDIKAKIRGKITSFFKNVGRAGATEYTRERESVPKSRKEYEKHVERISELLSPAHQERVVQYAKTLNDEGQPKLAEAAIQSYLKAKAYLSWNLPDGGLTKMDASMSLRPEPRKEGLDAKEWKFLFQSKIATDPMSILDKIEDGSVSSDEVQVMKYIYPKLHEEVVSAAADEIMTMKQAGKYMDYQKIQTLGIALDAPVDFFQQGENVSVLQQTLQMPPPEPNQKPQPGLQQQDSANIIKSLLTPSQKTSGIV